MSRMLSQLLLMAVLFFLPLAASLAQTQQPLRVGIHDKPPYAFQEADGSWQGLAVEAWQDVADRCQLTYVYVETPFEQLLDDLAAGRLDVVVGEIEINPDKAQSVRFTQPYLISAVGVIVRGQHGAWMQALEAFLTPGLLKIFAAILLGMVVIGMLVWVAERRHDSGHFRGRIRGLGSAIWFSAVTMTTVGYGDKTPSTFWGRFIAFWWMLAGVLLVAVFTAAFTSSLAAAHLGGMVIAEGDLGRMTTGVFRSTVAASVLKNKGYKTVEFDSEKAAFDALRSGEIDAFAADRVSLQYALHQLPGHKLALAPVSLRQTLLAMATRRDLPEYEAINQALLEVAFSEAWQHLLHQWLGRSAVGL